MTLDEMAEIHAASFTIPRPWSAEEIGDLLAIPNTHKFIGNRGFALFRSAGPEAELITIAVHPEMRRKRIARTLIEDMHAFAKTTDVEEIFLEVADQNYTAIGLYESVGYTHRGTRDGYYKGPNGEHISAIVMSYVI